MKRVIVLCLFALMLISPAARAEDINAIFKKVNDLVAAKNYPKAIEELGWAKKEIENLHTAQVQSFFPDDLAGYKGKDAQSNSAFGLTNIEKTYSSPDASTTIKLSLAGGAGGGAGGMFGGLADIGKMAAMMGANAGQNTFRISGRTASLERHDDSKTAQLTVFLESGSVLTFDMNGSSDGEALKKMAESLKINELDTYLKG